MDDAWVGGRVRLTLTDAQDMDYSRIYHIKGSNAAAFDGISECRARESAHRPVTKMSSPTNKHHFSSVAILWGGRAGCVTLVTLKGTPEYLHLH